MESLSRRTFLQFLLLTPLTLFSPPLAKRTLGVAQRTLWVREGLGGGLTDASGVASSQLLADPVTPHTHPSIIYVQG